MIRDTSDVKFYNLRCDGSVCGIKTIFEEDFSSIENKYDPIDIPGWSIVMVTGTKDWHGDGYDGQSAEVSAYNSNEDVNQTWMITPAIDLTSTTSPKLTFVSKLKYYKGDLLKVSVCTDYDGANPSAANWTELTTADIVDDNDPVESGSGFNYTTSGVIDLSNYTSSSIYIGWYYDGSGNDDKTTKYRVDDIKVYE